MSNQQKDEAKVTSKQIELKIPINANRERVWQAIVEEIGEWWCDDFYVYENARRVFEPFPGGRLYENAGNGAGGLWFTVMNISPPTMYLDSLCCFSERLSLTFQNFKYFWLVFSQCHR